MEVVITPDRAAMAVVVADAVQRLLHRKPDAVLGLATGGSPLPVYDELVRRFEAGGVSFAATTAFLLDEYVGLAPDHEQSYRAVIERELTTRVDFDPSRVHGPDGRADDIAAACAAYEGTITWAGGVDLQLLGIGGDGHLAFNEPGSSLASRTRIKTLTEQTRADNSRFFGSLDEVPHHVLTQGLGTILEARHLVLVAAGATKAEPIARAVEGPVTAMVPASVLQHHSHVSVVIDEEAASKLTLAGYYRETYAAKPPWQSL